MTPIELPYVPSIKKNKIIYSNLKNTNSTYTIPRAKVNYKKQETSESASSKEQDRREQEEEEEEQISRIILILHSI